MTKALASSYVNAALFWLLFYTAVWALLSGADGWTFGLPTIALATVLTLLLDITPWRLRVWRLPSLIASLFALATRGALELARLTIVGGKRGEWLRYRFRSEAPPSRLLLATCVSLIPGAIAAEIDAEHLRFQVLDSSVDWQARVALLDARITAVMPPTPTDED